MSRHRPRPWWARHRIATASAAGVVIVALVVVAAMALGPRPAVNRAQALPAAAQPTGTTTGTKPWPTIAVPTAPDSATPPPATTTTARPTPTRCSRCGDRTPPATPPPATTAAPTADHPAPAPAHPQPTVAVELLAYVNHDRAAAGCPPVTLNPSLDQQSQQHSEQQATDDRMYHSDGVTGFDTWAENVAYGYGTAADVHAGWMGSAPHRENILNCRYRYMGAGTAVSATGVRYWTEQFAR